jgi:DNA invertase Pin-like site-specific DNA recombinase
MRIVMLIGYARTSTVDQIAGIEAQERDLRAAGVDKLFAEQISAVDGDRPQLKAAIDFARDGDVFVVTKIDRLARSVADLLAIVEKLAAKGVALRILAMGIDTTTPTGKLMLTMLGGVAEFERAIMLERQREGIAKARIANKFKGRAPKARAKSAEIIKLAGAGMTRQAIADELGIGVASVYRVLAAKAKGATA